MQWLWRRPAAAAPIRPLVWEHPYAMGVALEKTKDKKKRKKKLLIIVIGVLISTVLEVRNYSLYFEGGGQLWSLSESLVAWPRAHRKYQTQVLNLCFSDSKACSLFRCTGRDTFLS